MNYFTDIRSLGWQIRQMSILFSWIWFIAVPVSLYFFAVAAFSDGAWSHFLWAFGIGALAKTLARGAMQSEKRNLFKRQLISEGYSQGEAQEEYAHQVTTGEWSIERVERIVQDYGGALEKRVPGPNGMVSDISQLPHPKNVIQNAILFMLERGRLDDGQKNALTTGFICLADFQPGVDSGDSSANIGSVEFDDLSTEQKIEKIAQTGTGEEWLGISEIERKELVKQLKSDGHWHEER